jgi:hypothetical protein
MEAHGGGLARCWDLFFCDDKILRVRMSGRRWVWAYCLIALYTVLAIIAAFGFASTSIMGIWYGILATVAITVPLTSTVVAMAIGIDRARKEVRSQLPHLTPTGRKFEAIPYDQVRSIEIHQPTRNSFYVKVATSTGRYAGSVKKLEVGELKEFLKGRVPEGVIDERILV